MVQPTPDMLAGQSIPWAYSDELLPAPTGSTWRTRVQWYAENDVDAGLLRVGPSRTRRTHAEKLEAVARWAEELDIWIEPAHSHTMLEGSVAYRVTDQVKVNPILGFNPSGYTQYFLDKDCPYPDCDAQINPTQHECAACTRPLMCAKCNSMMLVRVDKWYHGDEGLLCGGCARVCASGGCDTLIRMEHRFCREHGVFFTCADCEVEFDTYVSPSQTVNGVEFCNPCADHRCNQCGERQEDVMVQGMCAPCYDEKQKDKMERSDVPTMTADQWLMESLPDRPFRLVSIEQEFEARNPAEAGDPFSSTIRRRDSLCANRLAKALFDKGLSPYGELAGYHSSGHALPAHVETDSSVTSGGELIINRLRLDEFEDAEHMAAIQGIVKERLDMDEIRFTVKCGTHVHIDLHGYTIPDTRNLVTIYSYIEDVIYRLGSAGYKDHREILHGGEYSLPIRKDKWGDIKKFGVEYLRNADHTDSLNLQHFYNSLKTCKCGAIEFGSMSDCECIRKKCTAEWRVFNGTGDPTKLYAYIAVVQAVTAWCQNRQLNVDDYEPMEFQVGLSFTGQQTLKHAKMVDQWKNRLAWMFTNLPLTEPEREAIIYCILSGPLNAVGLEFIESLRQIERVREPGRTLPVPIMADRNDQPDHPYGFNASGYCLNCGESRRHCYCGQEDEYPADEPY